MDKETQDELIERLKGSFGFRVFNIVHVYFPGSGLSESEGWAAVKELVNLGRVAKMEGDNLLYRAIW